MLRTYLDTLSHTGSVPVKLLLGSFRDSLPETDRRRWNRTRFISELLALGFQVGESNGVATVAGISLPQSFTVRDGHLVIA